MRDHWLWRSRWAAVGAAVAVSIGGGGFFLASAAPGPAESTIVAVTPTRVLDTRNPVNLGLPGPFVSPVSQKLQITGVVPVAGGGTATVVPAGATGVLLNVTGATPSADGFVSIRPGDASGAPSTSSLNIEAGSNLPNSVQVALPTAGAGAGQIDITYDAYGAAGTTDLLIDIVGYTTNTGLQQLVDDVANKANTADVYAKSELGAAFVVRNADGLDFDSAGGVDHFLAQIQLPAGSYAFDANVMANNDSGLSSSFSCELRLGADVIDAIPQTQLAQVAFLGERQNVSLTGAATVTLAADGDIVSLVCNTASTSGIWMDISLRAVQVATINDGIAAVAS